jgi:hydrogenase maturation protease
MTGRLLVIGYGNPLRGDDGVGWRAAERLAQDAAARPGLEVIACQQLTPELAESLSHADRAVFIDAAAEGVPGAVSREVVEPADPGPEAFSHHLEPAGLLGMAQALYGHCPDARLITVVGERFDYSETLSPGVAAALDSVLQAVNDFDARPAMA